MPNTAIETFSDPDQEVRIALMQARTKRNRLLAESDWVVIRATDLGEPIPPEWHAYRQALRDITDQPDLFNIVWPTKPK